MSRLHYFQKLLFLLVLLSCTSAILFGQSIKDSLHFQLENAQLPEERWDAAWQLGKQYFRQEMTEVDSSLQFLRQSISIAKEHALDEQQALSYRWLGIVNFETNLPQEQLLPLLDTVITFHETCQCDVKGLMVSMTIKGLVFQFLGQQKKAIQTFTDCLEIAQREQDHRQMVALYNSMAGSLDEIEEAEKVLDYYQKGLAILDTLDRSPTRGRSVLLCNIADIYHTLDRYEEAEAYFQESVEIARVINDNHHLSVTLCQTANLYTTTDRWELAELTAKEGLTVARNAKHGNGIAICLNCLAVLAGKRQAYDQQIDYARQGIDLLEGNGQALYDLNMTFYKSTYEAFQNKNQYDSAFHYLAKHRELSDSLQQMRSSEQLQELELNFELQQAQYDNQLLQEQQNKAQLLLERRNGIIAVIIGFVSLLLGGFVWWSRKKDRINRQLEQLVKDRTQELENTVKHLEQANEELSYFSYITSHDLKEPLRNINGFASLLGRKLGNPSPGVKELINNLKQSTRQMENLIRDVMQYSLLSRKEADAERFPLAALIKTSRRDMEVLLLQRNGRILYKEDIWLEANQTALQLVITNLCTNAIKYNKSQSPTITISTTQHESGIDIHFSDNGIGIEPEFHEQIFLMFKRLHSRAEYEGSGLGLAIAKRVMDQQGGRISLVSAKDEGSIFTLHLPIALLSTPSNS